MDRMTVVPNRTVRPSGLALATIEAPILPPAPARFSTTTGCLTVVDKRSARSRPIISVDPPGENGITIVIGPSKSAAFAGMLPVIPRTPITAATAAGIHFVRQAPAFRFVLWFIKIGRASCRERVGQYVKYSVV